MKTLYTIGYAGKDYENFLKALNSYEINCIVDVRSKPYSKAFPEFDKYNLKRVLNKYDIKYLSFDKELGAQRVEENLYETNYDLSYKLIKYVSYKKVYDSTIFLDGVRRIENGVDKNYKICFMCSEKLPYECHRSIMVADYFYKNGYDIINIIDSDKHMNQNEVHLKIIEQLFEEKEKFYKNNQIGYDTNIFGEKNLNFIEQKWLEFFDSINPSNTLDKAYFLKNMQIGFKDGEGNE